MIASGVRLAVPDKIRVRIFHTAATLNDLANFGVMDSIPDLVIRLSRSSSFYTELVTHQQSGHTA